MLYSDSEYFVSYLSNSKCINASSSYVWSTFSYKIVNVFKNKILYFSEIVHLLLVVSHILNQAEIL